MSNKLLVKLDGKTVGHLWLDEQHIFVFQYEPSWIETSQIPLSLSLALKVEPYLNDEAHPFFANLLPEERLRATIARNLGVSPNNDFGILEKIGGDCAGAVSVLPETSKGKKEPSRYRELSRDELFAVIRELPKRPLLAGEKGIRLSLAGAQKKLPVFYDGTTFSLGYGSNSSNYIIKPAIETLDSSVENEAFCMALAREMELAVPYSFILEHEGERVFVVERYDRLTQGDQVKRLHQEDFCQALGILPEFKYEAEGGPTLKASVQVLRNSSTKSGADVLSLLNWVIFNYLIGNSDTHGKNLSLLLLPEGPRLAPFYDLLSTRIYAHYGVSEALAMRIGGEDSPSKIHKEQWGRLAEEIGVKPKLVFTRITELSINIHKTALQLFKGPFANYKCDALYRLLEFVANQAQMSLNGNFHSRVSRD